MNEVFSLSDFNLFSPTYVWLAVTFLLLIFEMLILPNFILNFSISALIMTAGHYFQLINLPIIYELMIFALITSFLIIPIRFLLKKIYHEPDINDYN